MGNGVTLKCRGPVDTYGDEKPDGVSGRVGFMYLVRGVAEHRFMLEIDEVEKLRDDLTAVLYQIAINRARVRSSPPSDKEEGGPLDKRRLQAAR